MSQRVLFILHPSAFILPPSLVLMPLVGTGKVNCSGHMRHQPAKFGFRGPQAIEPQSPNCLRGLANETKSIAAKEVRSDATVPGFSIEPYLCPDASSPDAVKRPVARPRRDPSASNQG